jgi:O-antigen/teichoic acid export membrane protein
MIWQKIKSLFPHGAGIKETALRNIFWLTLGTSISKVIRALLIIYAARVLGTSGYGVFSYALSLAAFFTIFSDIGLSPLLTREASKKPGALPAYFSTTLTLKLILLSITALVTVTLAPFFTKIPEARALIPLVAVLLVFDSLRDFGLSVTHAQNRMDLEALFNIATNLAITGLGLVILFYRPTPTALAASYTIGSGIGLFLVFAFLLRRLRNLTYHFDRKLVRPILKSAWPFAVMGLFGSFMINIDMLFLGWFRSAHELGLYGAIQRLLQLFYIVPALIATGLFPIISRLAEEKNTERARDITEKSLAANFLIALPLAAGGIILSRPLLVFIFGPAYTEAALALQLLLLTLLLVFPGTLIANTIFAYDAQKIFILATALGAGANAVLDYLLIPAYGIAGSALATVVSLTLIVGVNWVSLRQIVSFALLPHLPRILAATALMATATAIFQFAAVPVLTNALISGGLYFATLFFLREPLLTLLRR